MREIVPFIGKPQKKASTSMRFFEQPKDVFNKALLLSMLFSLVDQVSAQKNSASDTTVGEGILIGMLAIYGLAILAIPVCGIILCIQMCRSNNAAPAAPDDKQYVPPVYSSDDIEAGYQQTALALSRRQ